MYEMYADDSGTDSSSPLAIAACYISTKRSWSQFAEEWDRVGQSEGFTVFHMKEFSARREFGIKPFCDWDNDQRKRIYQRLARIINDHKRVGFGIAVPKNVFDRIVPTLPEPVRTKCGTHHYTFAVKVLLTLIADWRQKCGIKAPMRYVFDQMGKGKGEIMSMWDHIDDFDAQGKLGMERKGYAFENKAIHKPLQRQISSHGK